MKKIYSILTIFSISQVIGCVTGDRSPASLSPSLEQDLVKIQAEQNRQQDLRYNIEYSITKKTEVSKYKSLKEQLAVSVQETEAMKLEVAQSLAEKKNHPDSVLFSAPNPYQKIEELILDNDAFKQMDSQSNEYAYILDSSGQTDYWLALGYLPDPPDPLHAPKVQLSCDGDFALDTDRTKNMYIYQKEKYFEFNDKGTGGRSYFFKPSAGLHTCEMKITLSGSKKTYKVHLQTNEGLLSARLNSEKEACFLPESNQMTAAQKLFYTSNFINMTCPNTPNNFEILNNPMLGVQKKLKALLGVVIPQETLEKQDPYFTMSCSKAPDLDAVYISALVFRRDFYGTVLLRALECQAKLGTEIKIFNSAVIEQKKDHIALNAFMQKYPNVKYLSYHYPSKWGRGIKDKMDGLHRTNHIKMFAAISKSHPENNVLIVGGRNVHDGFIFEKQPDYSKHPELVQYDGSDENFIHWMDLEILISSPKMTHDVVRQMYSMWNYDHETAKFQSVGIQISVPKIDFKSPDENEILLRHIYSAPYRDGQALESFYVEMFGTARKNITLVSPYLRLTPKIAEAMEKAIIRGVEIRIFTRINLKGDTADVVLTDVNKEAINRLKDKVAIYEWTKPGVILHSKLVLIDDTLSFNGGINLNKRSFIHDFENGTLIYNKSINAHFREIIKTYEAGSRLVTEKQKTKWWTGVIIWPLDDVFIQEQ
jgi:cardiolipin synthase